jgi:hypothetical protein
MRYTLAGLGRFGDEIELREIQCCRGERGKKNCIGIWRGWNVKNSRFCDAIQQHLDKDITCGY